LWRVAADDAQCECLFGIRIAGPQDFETCAFV